MIKILLKLYRFKRRHKLRLLIKYLIKNKRFKIKHRNFELNVGTDSFIESLIIFNEYNEEFILDLVEFYVNKGYGVIDIGANIGLHSLTAAGVRKDVEIYAFEPEPNNYFNFIQNITLNNFKTIRPFNVGLGDQLAILSLNINGDWNKGKHSLVKEFANKDTVTVPVFTLDSFKNTIISESLFVKIDVEGFEKQVIEGAKAILKEKKNIILCIELVSGNNSKDSCQDILDTLAGYGFKKLYKFKNNELNLVSSYDKSGDYILLKGKQTIDYYDEVLSSRKY